MSAGQLVKCIQHFTAIYFPGIPPRTNSAMCVSAPGCVVYSVGDVCSLEFLQSSEIRCVLTLIMLTAMYHLIHVYCPSALTRATKLKVGRTRNAAVVFSQLCQYEDEIRPMTLTVDV